MVSIQTKKLSRCPLLRQGCLNKGRGNKGARLRILFSQDVEKKTPAS